MEKTALSRIQTHGLLIVRRVLYYCVTTSPCKLLMLMNGAFFATYKLTSVCRIVPSRHAEDILE